MAAMMPGGILGRRMIAVITAATAISAVALLPGCASSGPQASALASDLGCGSGFPENPPGPGTLQQAGCTLEDGTSVQVVTFGSTRDETVWIAEWCRRLVPPSAGCIEGILWVATYNSLPALARRDRQRIVSAIGGHLVGKAA
jgi:hypothetical protein